jgi:lysophospholipase L1-like esterase
MDLVCHSVSRTDLDVKGWGWVAGEHQVPLIAYICNLHTIIDALEGTGAQLLWATTTPAPPPHTIKQGTPSNPDWPTDPIQYTTKDVLTYNEAATNVMRSRGVPINDLYEFVLPQLDRLQHPQDVHFTDAGSAVLGDYVATVIKGMLPPPRAPKL